MGKIAAGDMAGQFGRVSDSDPILAELKSKTAGIFALHAGAKVRVPAGKTFSSGDATTYEDDIGRIEIVSKADIESKGDGIFAFVKDIDDTLSDERRIRTIIPVTIDVMGGMILAKRDGIHVESAGTGEIAVTVGEKARVKAEMNGVRVKGTTGTRTVTINGRVMGGGEDDKGH